MAYSGSTAATPNPPICVTGGIGKGRGSSALTGQNKSLWMYISSDASTDIVASNYFTDGWYLGIRPGDVLLGTQYTTAGSSVITFQASFATVTTAGASLSTGGLMTSTFA